MTWGYHLLLNCSDCNDGIQNEETIKRFVYVLIKAIDMKPVGPTIIRHLSPTPENTGYSVMQMIETSNITAHFVESNRSAYIDVFSCKEFDPTIVERLVDFYFSPGSVIKTFLTRQA
jgi:S-adenosylmethionine/arginine decarboxylase-like enzyme